MTPRWARAGHALAALVDRTYGRRLMARIWAHGVLLFLGVILTVLLGRHLLADVDYASTVRVYPYFARAAAELVLAKRGDARAFAVELDRANRRTPLRVGAFSPAGVAYPGLPERPLPPVAPPSAEELSWLTPTEPVIWWHHHRLIVAAYDGAELAAIVVLVAPVPPSLTWHLVVFVAMAVILAFVCAAAPLAFAIARPLGRLRALTQRLGAGDLTTRAHWRRRDELGDLARAFDAMAEQIQKLRAAERQLLGDVSHELRTPLSRMRVVLALAEGAELPRARAYLAEITTDLGELEELIDDIITSVRLDASPAQWNEAEPPLRRSRHLAESLVDSAAERFRARWDQRALEVRVEDLRGAALDGDPTMLRRALDNLLDNARKYSADDSTITLRASRQEMRLRLEVLDRGLGISEEDRPRVFSPFFRADKSRARTSGGVGLGLALARRIVLSHGGAIGFESELGQGSRFWIELPLAAPDGEPAGDAPAAR